MPDEEEILILPDHNYIVENVTIEERYPIYLKCHNLLPQLPSD